MRIAGIDLGKVRIGLAISDLSQVLASAAAVILAKATLKETAEAIAQSLSNYMPIEKIVIGFPLLMNGKEGEAAEQIRLFTPFLEEITGLSTILWDERLTTAQVERVLKEAGLSRKKRTRYVDAMAASAILQSYLDSVHMSTPHCHLPHDVRTKRS